ncbi:MAG: cobalt-precorrin-5B (C(1))-methyltransferase CbiD [Desulfobacula sp.]|nr:cobalt-precorrin-5B (C(1))-methyltransferase CbiD [Desulfobacula sp.]
MAAALKKGFTTGAAAAAAVKAALISFFAEPPRSVDLLFLTGERKPIEIKAVEKISGHEIQALVVKDAGDDPDITHRAVIGARVRLSDSASLVITIRGGKGVGRVTKPGLELPVGEPAINPGPRTMIQNSVTEVFRQFKLPAKQVDIEIFVPEGEALALKTLNPRLGILGGISILGTTGIVTPMSHEAYIATIRSGISVAAAGGAHTLVFTTGRRSERAALEKFKELKSEVFIQTGDFFRAALEEALARHEIKAVVYVVFFGKALKMALGHEHTHAARSELTLQSLAHWAHETTGSRDLEQRIAGANTARHAFSFIYPEYPDLLARVGQKALAAARFFSKERLQIRIIILDFDGNPAFDSAVTPFYPEVP